MCEPTALPRALTAALAFTCLHRAGTCRPCYCAMSAAAAAARRVQPAFAALPLKRQGLGLEPGRMQARSHPEPRRMRAAGRQIHHHQKKRRQRRHAACHAPPYVSYPYWCSKRQRQVFLRRLRTSCHNGTRCRLHRRMTPTWGRDCGGRGPQAPDRAETTAALAAILFFVASGFVFCRFGFFFVSLRSRGFVLCRFAPARAASGVTSRWCAAHAAVKQEQERSAAAEDCGSGLHLQLSCAGAREDGCRRAQKCVSRQDRHGLHVAMRCLLLGGGASQCARA